MLLGWHTLEGTGLSSSQQPLSCSVYTLVYCRTSRIRQHMQEVRWPAVCLIVIAQSLHSHRGCLRAMHNVNHCSTRSHCPYLQVQNRVDMLSNVQPSLNGTSLWCDGISHVTIISRATITNPITTSVIMITISPIIEVMITITAIALPSPPHCRGLLCFALQLHSDCQWCPNTPNEQLGRTGRMHWDLEKMSCALSTHVHMYQPTHWSTCDQNHTKYACKRMHTHTYTHTHTHTHTPHTHTHTRHCRRKTLHTMKSNQSLDRVHHWQSPVPQCTK